MDRNHQAPQTMRGYSVALRKESVDRNTASGLKSNLELSSLSARRAWIEIFTSSAMYLNLLVALRKESVDRNMAEMNEAVQAAGRSPQGERG